MSGYPTTLVPTDGVVSVSMVSSTGTARTFIYVSNSSD